MLFKAIFKASKETEPVFRTGVIILKKRKEKKEMQTLKKMTGNLAGYLTVKGEQLKENAIWHKEEGVGLMEYIILLLVVVALSVILYLNMKSFFDEFLAWVINKIKTTFGM